MTRVPLGTLISMPSMVSVTRSSGGMAASPPPEGALVVTVHAGSSGTDAVEFGFAAHRDNPMLPLAK
ncbi:hypothetical protein, partial [Mycobacteroides abscessus]|uniref:hypothetical protein n=1 Tax=Mycobacteroides abscessus TaxID=36809 RepID=UPI00210491AB